MCTPAFTLFPFWGRVQTQWEQNLEYVIDAVFLVDIVLSFHTGSPFPSLTFAHAPRYSPSPQRLERPPPFSLHTASPTLGFFVVSTGEFVFDKNEVAKHYAKTWYVKL